MISEKDYNDLKDLATFVQSEVNAIDPAKYPETHAAFAAWVALIYKIMKDYRYYMESM
jgi:hypothetical protein